MARVYSMYRSKRNSGPITIRLSHQDYRNKINLYISSTYVIDKEIWDSKKKTVKAKDAKSRNQRNKIQKLEDFVMDRFKEDYSKNITIDRDWGRLQVEKFFGRFQESNKIEFIEYYENYISKYSKKPHITTGRVLADSTIKTYKNSLKLLKKFEEENYKLKFNTITTDFYNDFLDFLYDRNLSTNYIGAQIKNIKAIMNISFEEGFHNNLDFKKRTFKKTSESVYNVYLNKEELDKINNLDLDKSPIDYSFANVLVTKKNIKIAKDLFLIGAYTGLRISDFTNIKNKNIVFIDGLKCIKTNIKKTNGFLVIPLAQTIEGVLIKYKDSDIPNISLPTINYCIKEICRMAGIDEIIEKEESKGRIKVIKKYKKYEMVSSHTARRSFCTNAYKSGMPTLDIMSISGHVTEQVFFNYIKVTQEERAIKIGKHKFFN